ncbi:MAG: outer membrane protein transport protein [Pseudomonadota bacterium]
MIKKTLGTGILAASAAALMATSATAGGYGRGSVDVAPLLGDGLTAGGGFTIVSPTRRITAVNGTATTGNARTDFASTYVVPNAFASSPIAGSEARCMAGYTQPYGAKADYGSAQILTAAVTGTGQPISTTTANELSSHELGLTCSYGFDAGPVKAYIIGGAFAQYVSYTETKGAIVGGNFTDNIANLSGDDTGFGYRVGLGISKEDIALKASLVYRSRVNHNVTGTQTLGPIAAAGAAASSTLTAAQLAGTYGFTAAATTPQSLKLSFQTGIAPKTLLFGSVEWTDWSVLQQVQVLGNGTGTATAAALVNGRPTPGSPTIDAFFRDGWTVNIGAARQLTEKASILGAYTWDRGTGSGRSGFSDTHTLAAGVNYKANDNLSVRAGLAYSYLTSVTYNTTDIANNAVTVTNGAGNALAGALSVSLTF